MQQGNEPTTMDAGVNVCKAGCSASNVCPFSPARRAKGSWSARRSAKVWGGSNNFCGPPFILFAVGCIVLW